MTGLRPGVVLVVRSNGWAAETVRIGAALAGKPNLSNHVAVVHHTDPAGTTWCVEGRPGGVGWRDARAYLASQWTVSTAVQPFTAAQGAQVAKTMQVLLGAPYDWEAVCADALAVVGITMPGWDPSWHGTVPGHVVCSSAAQYAYAKAGLARPAGDRGCTPGDWDAFIVTRGWS